MSTYLILLLSLLILSPLASAKVLRNDKFESLDCDHLEEQTILTQLRPQFSSLQHHLPIKNYAFSFGPYSLANCWSLSHLQRLYFYLHENVETSAQQLADLVRGFSPYQADENLWRAWPVPAGVIPTYGQSEWQELGKGFVQSGEFGGELARSLKSEIEAFQIRRFHDLRNLQYLSGPLARTEVENRQTMALLQKMLSAHQLPLILLRPHPYSQHVVLVKRIEGRRLIVYDSNYPSIENEMDFDAVRAAFTAPQIIRGLPHVENEHLPIGVFIIDSGELKPIRQALTTFYRRTCKLVP